MEANEKTITDAIIRRLAKIPNSFVRKIHGNRMQGAGLPDIYFTCWYLDGRSVWIEVKKPGRKATRIQDYTIEQLRRAGSDSFVATSVSDIEEWILRMGIESS